eukprot:7223-Heterococcus_DN1.PRE.4
MTDSSLKKPRFVRVLLWPCDTMRMLARGRTPSSVHYSQLHKTSYLNYNRWDKRRNEVVSAQAFTVQRVLKAQLGGERRGCSVGQLGKERVKERVSNSPQSRRCANQTADIAGVRPFSARATMLYLTLDCYFYFGERRAHTRQECPRNPCFAVVHRVSGPVDLQLVHYLVEIADSSESAF